MQNLAATVSCLWFFPRSLCTLCSTLPTCGSLHLSSSFIWKNKNYQKEGSGERVWDVKPPLPLPCLFPVCLKTVQPSIQTATEEKQFAEHRLGLSTKHAEGKRHSSPRFLFHCRFSHTDVMTLHVCSLTHKPKNTLHAGRHWENQTLDSEFHWKIL